MSFIGQVKFNARRSGSGNVTTFSAIARYRVASDMAAPGAVLHLDVRSKEATEVWEQGFYRLLGTGELELLEVTDSYLRTGVDTGATISPVNFPADTEVVVSAVENSRTTTSITDSGIQNGEKVAAALGLPSTTRDRTIQAGNVLTIATLDNPNTVTNILAVDQDNAANYVSATIRVGEAENGEHPFFIEYDASGDIGIVASEPTFSVQNNSNSVMVIYTSVERVVRASI